MAENTYKLEITFGDRAWEKLCKMQEKTGRANKTAVVADALGYLWSILDGKILTAPAGEICVAVVSGLVSSDTVFMQLPHDMCFEEVMEEWRQGSDKSLEAFLAEHGAKRITIKTV